jgi:hypothetical protein
VTIRLGATVRAHLSIERIIRGTYNRKKKLKAGKTSELVQAT